MRTRTRDLQDEKLTIRTDSLNVSELHGSDPVYTENSSTDEYIVSGGSEYMDDIVTPGFQALRDRGFIINNPMESMRTIEADGHFVYDLTYYYRTTNHNTHIRQTYTNKVGTFNDSGSYPSFLSLGTFDIETMKSLAISRAWAKVSAAPWQALVSVAEAKKTLDLVKDLIHLVIKVVRFAKSLRSRVAAGTLTAAKAAQLWLQYRYGVRPTLYEISSALEAIGSIGKETRTRFTSSVLDTSDNTDEQSFVLGSAPYTTNVTVARTASRRVRVSAGVLVEPRVNHVTFDQALGLDEIITTIWELVPYSFVVDWFLNVQDWLASWSPKVDVVPLTSWVSVYDRKRQTNEVTEYDVDEVWTDVAWVPDETAPPCSSSLGMSFPYKLETIYRDRQPHPDRPAIPSLNIRLNVAKLVDLAALGYQLAKS